MNTFIVADSCCDLPLSFVELHKDHLEIIGMPIFELSIVSPLQLNKVF